MVLKILSDQDVVPCPQLKDALVAIRTSGPDAVQQNYCAFARSDSGLNALELR